MLEFKGDGGSSDSQPEQSGGGDTGVRQEVEEENRREAGRGVVEGRTTVCSV